MPCDFFWISGSPFSWRVHLALEFKAVDYTPHRLNASYGEHETPEFLALNPHGKVPVLKDGETVIYESIAILAYLEAQYDGPRIFGDSPEETGLIWQHIHEVENYARNPLLKMAIAILAHQFVENPAETNDLKDECEKQLNWIESVSARATWFAGDSISAADFVLFPVLKMFLRAAEKQNATVLNLDITPLTKRFPATANWMANIESLPGYERTYPPHWIS